jgi:polysaccharide export outer membrane protein
MIKQVCGAYFIAVILLISAAFAQDNPPPITEEYIIGPGDALEISVWKEDTLTKMLTVLPDGKLTFPLIGNITAAGRSTNQIKTELTTRLAHYISDPIVSVVVHEVNSLLIYVVGKVHKPDRYILNSRVKVLQALAMAGGLNQFSKSRQVRIFRDKGEQTKIFAFDYEKVSKGKNLEQNIFLQRGDVIVVR